ncbi:HAD family hydrolase [Paraeggerthella hongkongensis]|uniref:HAD family hydrolase n=1 Tax=Paraeggerthella hongkongensis TaxID=230658 RepID=A0A3N0BJ81_9ACTN|nr:HAD-IA family hydrolase [Paraeggerthella hongkongensis]RNL48176.1 HAD family hydrolase [Paraeggerthella hongkongensis]
MNGGSAAVKAVFFDVGSTLLYPGPSVAETFARVAQERGHDLTVRDVEPHMPAMDAYYEAEYLRDGDFWCSHEGSVAIWMDQYRYVCHLTGISHDAEGMAQSVHEAYRKGDHWALYPDVMGCLRALKQRGLALAVVSNWDAGLEGLLRDLRLLPYFDAVVSSAVVGYRKPDPVIFDLACEQLGVCADAVVHVGDRPDADGDGACAAGIRPIIIDRHDTETESGYERVGVLTDIDKLLG